MRETMGYVLIDGVRWKIKRVSETVLSAEPPPHRHPNKPFFRAPSDEEISQFTGKYAEWMGDSDTPVGFYVYYMLSNTSQMTDEERDAWIEQAWNDLSAN